MSNKKEKGAILIITLWILAILTILSVGVAGRMGLELKLTGFYRDNMKALYLAKAGVERAIAVIEEDGDHKEGGIDWLNEPWSNNKINEEGKEDEPLFKDIDLGGIGTFTVSYPFSENQTFYGMQDEERRIDINNAPKEVIQKLIEYLCGAEGASELAALIVDWRDGPEAGEYDYAEEGYPRKDDLFDTVEELLLVKNMTSEIFYKIKDFITVYPRSTGTSKVNINTAPLPVLYALGFENYAGALISFRNEGDNHFEDKNAVLEVLKDAGYEGAELPGASKDLAVFGSQYFRIICTAETSGRKIRKIVTAIIGPKGASEWAILYWNEQ